MYRRIALAALIAFALSTSALAQSVAGAWDLAINGPEGPINATATLKQDGENVTGSIETPQGTAEMKGTYKGKALKPNKRFYLGVSSSYYCVAIEYKNNYNRKKPLYSVLPLITRIEKKAATGKKEMLKTDSKAYLNAHPKNARKRLATTELTMGEVAYELGFEHLQPFNKLLKTSLSPLLFRQSFNWNSYSFVLQANAIFTVVKYTICDLFNKHPF